MELNPVNVNYKYIEDGENTVAFKTFRNSISATNYTDSMGDTKNGNFKQTETALSTANNNFTTIMNTVADLETNMATLNNNVSEYLGQSQVFNVTAKLAQAETSSTQNTYIMTSPTLTQEPQKGAMLLLQVDATNANTSGKNVVKLTYIDPDTNEETEQTYNLVLAKNNAGIPTGAIKPNLIYTFVLADSENFKNVESKLSRRVEGTFGLIGKLQGIETYGNSWATDGSMLYLNLVLGKNDASVTPTATAIANLTGADFLPTDKVIGHFPAFSRGASSDSGATLLYVRCYIKNKQLICVAPGTTPLQYFSLNVAVPLPTNTVVF